MALKSHDLVQIRDITEVLKSVNKLSWVEDSLQTCPWAVIRRAPLQNDTIPIGIRGKTRSERLACSLNTSNIASIVTPETLAKEKWWHHHRTKVPLPFQVLDDVNEIMKRYPLPWGPGGSVGFELVTGVPCVSDKSDIDLIIRSPGHLDKNVAKEMVHDFSALDTRIDVQVETGIGAFSLIEYARDDPPILLRTTKGPKLVRDPWIAPNKIK